MSTLNKNNRIRKIMEKWENSYERAQQIPDKESRLTITHEVNLRYFKEIDQYKYLGTKYLEPVSA